MCENILDSTDLFHDSLCVYIFVFVSMCMNFSSVWYMSAHARVCSCVCVCEFCSVSSRFKFIYEDFSVI